MKNWLNKVDMRFCRIDPLQHHGHWILSKEELNCLDESYIPISVVNGALCLQGPSSLSATIDMEKTRIGLRRNVVATLQNITDLFDKYQNKKINLYEMKALVGSFLLMPAYLFQLNNHRVSKKWAIENINTLLPANACNIVYASEEIRKNWAIPLSGWRYAMFRITPFLFANPHLYRIFASKFAPRFMVNQLPILASNDVDDFVAHCRALLNR